MPKNTFIVPRESQRAYNEWTGYVNAYNNWYEANSDDEEFINDYWKDETAAFGWQRSKEDPSILLLVYELAVGGPNAHLVFFYKITEEYDDYEPEIEYLKTEFQYHWWSPGSILDLTKCPDNVDWEIGQLFEASDTCLEQIEEEAMDMLESNYETILAGDE